MFKRILVVAILLVAVGGSGLYAQSSRLKRAKKLMHDLDYVGAIELYNQILESQDNSEAKINIAECYRKISDSQNAEYWYGQVVRLPEAEPIHLLYYGQALHRNGKCDLAKEWYIKFVEAVPDDLRGQYLEKACDYEEELMTKNAGIYEIQHLDFNSNLDDFSPAYFENGLVFASERDKGTAVERTHSWTDRPFLELFFVEAKESGGEEEGACGNFTYGRAEKFGRRLNSKFHDAAVAFNQDQTEIFFTRNNLTGKDDEGLIRLKIYSAKGSGNSWGSEEGMPFNSDEYSVGHPTLSPDGNTLYFTSDMPGGFGGMDLYKSERESGRWGPPMNLGPQINTEGNELFPYYDAAKEYLYFASNGHIGLGGLDIYYMEDRGNGEWGNIENIGYPINTISDDFSIIFNEEGTCGYFSSDRSGGAGLDDIYSFKKIAVPVEVLVYDETTGEPIEGAAVVNECNGQMFETNESGRVVLDMRINDCCTFTASSEGYLTNDKEGCTTSDMSQLLLVEIPLRNELVFDLKGFVFDSNTDAPIEGATVILRNDCDDEEQTATTDVNGSFSFDLKEDCCYTLEGSTEEYAPKTIDNQCTRDLTESTTLQTNIYLGEKTIADNSSITESTTVTPNVPIYSVNDEETRPKTGVYYDREREMYVDAATGQPANGVYGDLEYHDGQMVGSNSGFDVGYVNEGGSVAYLLHIYYDFDQSYLREEAIPELEKLLTLMNNNTDYVVEIGSHTDARGSDRYNDRLSQRRAESVVRWLVDNGIDRERLVARGYGEDMNVNNCSNNIPCTEQEHQFNRRTEFRILTCRDCPDSYQESQPKSDPRVDPCEGCPF